MTAPHAAICPVYVRVAPADIAYVKFLFESYEGVGIVRTVDRHAAIIVVLVVEDFLPDVHAILRELQGALVCAAVDAPPIDPDDWLMRELDE